MPHGKVIGILPALTTNVFRWFLDNQFFTMIGARRRNLPIQKQDTTAVALFFMNMVNEGVCCNPMDNYRAMSCNCMMSFSSCLEEEQDDVIKAVIAFTCTEKSQQ